MQHANNILATASAIGQPVPPPVAKAPPPTAADLTPRAAEEWDAPVATGGMPTGGWR
jgi:hypothetical protein